MNKLILSLLSIMCIMIFSSTLLATEKSFKAVAEEYPPFTDSKIPSQGWTWAIIKAALETQGYKNISLDFIPWARAVTLSKKGEYDGLLNAYWNKERTKHYLFSVPIGKVGTWLFRRKDRSDILYNGNLESIKNYYIGVVRGYTISDVFDKADFLKKQKVVNTEQGLKMLFKNRLDLFASGSFSDERNLFKRLEVDKKGITNIIVRMEPPLQIQYLHMAVSLNALDCHRKTEDLNVGMRKIMLNGVYRKILYEHGMLSSYD